MAAQFVNPYRKNGKNDVKDAEALCEAVGRPNMRFVPQERGTAEVTDGAPDSIPGGGPTAQLKSIRSEVSWVSSDWWFHWGSGACEHGYLPDSGECRERPATVLARQSEPARRVVALEGIGPITVTAFEAGVGDARVFKNGRQFVAWLGLTPRRYSGGGTTRDRPDLPRGAIGTYACRWCPVLAHTKVVGRVVIATGHPWLYGHAKNDVGGFEDRVHGPTHSQL